MHFSSDGQDSLALRPDLCSQVVRCVLTGELRGDYSIAYSFKYSPRNEIGELCVFLAPTYRLTYTTTYN